MALVSKKKNPNHSKEISKKRGFFFPVYSMFLTIYYSTLCTFVTVWFQHLRRHTIGTDLEAASGDDVIEA